MSPLRSAVRALPMTFVIYVVEALLASFAALPLATELSRAGHALGDPSATAIVLESIEPLAGLLRSAGVSLALGAALLALLAPWLQMSWLHALTEHSALFSSLARGARLYGRAWLISIYVLLLALLAALPFAAGAFLLHEHYDAAIEARRHDLAVCSALLPLAPLLLSLGVLHDAARARALTHGAWASVRHSLCVALRPRMLAYGLLFALLGWAPVLLVQALMSKLSAGGVGAALGALLLQGSLLGKLFARSTWLACAHRQIAPLADQPDGPRSSEDEA